MECRISSIFSHLNSKLQIFGQPNSASRQTPAAEAASGADGPTHLTRGKLAGIDNLVGFLDDGLLVGAVQRGSGQGHEAGTGRLEDAKRRDQLEERVDPRLLGRAVTVLA